jgi:hypothetical protein
MMRTPKGRAPTRAQNPPARSYTTKSTSQLARSGSWTSSRASIAALLSSSVRFNDSINCSVLALLLPVRTTPPMARAIPTIIRAGVKSIRPSIKQTNIAGPTTALACPANMSLRLRSIASRSSSIRISSCSICSTGANPIVSREVPCNARASCQSARNRSPPSIARRRPETGDNRPMSRRRVRADDMLRLRPLGPEDLLLGLREAQNRDASGG